MQYKDFILVMRSSATKVVFSLLAVSAASVGLYVLLTTTKDGSVPKTYRNERDSNANCTDHLINGLQCQDVPNICHDIYGQIICQSSCQTCGMAANPCVDHVERGLSCAELPEFCKDSHARQVCPKLCGFCGPHHVTSPGSPLSTIAPTPSPCEDYIGEGLSCGQIPSLCSDVFGRLLCRRTCNECHPSNSSGGGSATPRPSTSLSTRCMDHVVGPFTCSQLPAICTKAIGRVVCQRHCEFCPTTPPPTGLCVDNIGKGMSCADGQFGDICSKSYAQLLCPRFCNMCGTRPTEPATHKRCEDNVGSGLDCKHLQNQGFCTSSYSRLICRRTCGFCQPETTTAASTTSTSPPTTTTDLEVCEDKVIPPTTCADLAAKFPTLCSDDYARVTCRKFCGICTATETKTAVQPTTSPTGSAVGSSTGITCSPTPSPSCVDFAESEVCNLNDFCKNPYSRVVCKRTCNYCEDGCFDRLPPGTNCNDLYGSGMALTSQAELCNDTLGSQVCERTCGCRGHCQP